MSCDLQVLKKSRRSLSGRAKMPIVLLRLPYLALTSVFTFIRLLPMSDTDKDIEILTLRHQLTILQRQTPKPRLTSADRALLAALLHRSPAPG
jgi:putative transposase